MTRWTGYRYASVWGFWLARDGARWAVHAPSGEVVARSRDWYAAALWMLAQRPAQEAVP